MGTISRGPLVVTANQMKDGLPEERAKWSISEQSELQRLQAAYPPPYYEMESSATEEGDPWCVVCDSALDRIVVHIARIGGRYVIVHSEKNINKAVAQIKTAIDLVTQ
jgi:hypothetical protein